MIYNIKTIFKSKTKESKRVDVKSIKGRCVILDTEQYGANLPYEIGIIVRDLTTKQDLFAISYVLNDTPFESIMNNKFIQKKLEYYENKTSVLPFINKIQDSKSKCVNVSKRQFLKELELLLKEYQVRYILTFKAKTDLTSIYNVANLIHYRIPLFDKLLSIDLWQVCNDYLKEHPRVLKKYKCITIQTLKGYVSTKLYDFSIYFLHTIQTHYALEDAFLTKKLFNKLCSKLDTIYLNNINDKEYKKEYKNPNSYLKVK